MPQTAVDDLGENDTIVIDGNDYKVLKKTINSKGVWLRLETLGGSPRFKRFNSGDKVTKR